MNNEINIKELTFYLLTVYREALIFYDFTKNVQFKKKMFKRKNPIKHYNLVIWRFCDHKLV